MFGKLAIGRQFSGELVSEWAGKEFNMSCDVGCVLIFFPFLALQVTARLQLYLFAGCNFALYALENFESNSYN